MPNPPFPLLRFVAAPSLDAEVFFDFNPHGIKPDSFSLGSPSYLGDVDAIAPSLGFRSVSFTAHFASSKFDNARDAVRLSREMARDRNWLLWWSDDKVPRCGSGPIPVRRVRCRGTGGGPSGSPTCSRCRW
ncbi:MAG: hypothetical protein HZY75_13385 [Nocardioidaceae bacterium]|nr:MAG: hypothetical protein HZY75_13385 [Nocardioidaceae bacterium]